MAHGWTLKRLFFFNAWPESHTLEKKMLLSSNKPCALSVTRGHCAGDGGGRGSPHAPCGSNFKPGGRTWPWLQTRPEATSPPPLSQLRAGETTGRLGGHRARPPALRTFAAWGDGSPRWRCRRPRLLKGQRQHRVSLLKLLPPPRPPLPQPSRAPRHKPILHPSPGREILLSL